MTSLSSADMNQPNPDFAPVVSSSSSSERREPAASRRFVGYDVARCLAFCGMVIVNYRVLFGWGAAGPDWLKEGMGFFTGRAAATFVILAGVGMSLMMRGRRGGIAPMSRIVVQQVALFLAVAIGVVACALNVFISSRGRPVSFTRVVRGAGERDGELFGDVADRWRQFFDAVRGGELVTFLMVTGVVVVAWLALAGYLRRRGSPSGVLLNRALFLFVGGYAWYPYWSGDILHFYGVYLALGTVVLGLRARWLVLIGVVVLVAATGLHAIRPFEQGWNAFGFEYLRGEFWSVAGAIRGQFFNGWHPVFPWFAFIVIGIVLGRMDAGRRRNAILLVVTGVALYVGARVVSPLLVREIDAQITSRFSSVMTKPVDGTRRWTGRDDAADADVLNEAPVRRTVVGEGVNRRANRDVLRAVGRLRRELGGRGMSSLSNDGKDAPVFRVQTTLEAQKARSTQGARDEATPSPLARAVVTLDYGDATSTSTDGEVRAHFDSVVARVVGMINAEPAVESSGEGWGISEEDLRWPEALERFELRRTIPVVDGDGVVSRAVVETVTVDVAIAKEAETLRRLRGPARTASSRPGVMYVMSATGTAFIVIGFCLLIAGIGRVRRLLYPFMAAGQMALSLYVAHVLVGRTVIELLGKNQGQTMPFIATVIVVTWCLSIAFAAAWRALFRRGPLEAVMRTLTG